MKQHATMVGAICLDKGTDGDGFPAPITFKVMRVMAGSMFPGHNRQDLTLQGDLETLADAVKVLHQKFILHVEDDRYSPCRSFWLENYRSLRSKWQTWAKKQRHSFRYDNYTVCIVTSNGDLVY